MEISLQTYDRLEGKVDAIIYIQSQINQREGTQIDYGFSSEEERALFRKITSVSGMGASSARMILSSLSPSELKEAILCEDVTRLKSVKGIGLKVHKDSYWSLKTNSIKMMNTTQSYSSAQTRVTTPKRLWQH